MVIIVKLELTVYDVLRTGIQVTKMNKNLFLCTSVFVFVYTQFTKQFQGTFTQISNERNNM